MWEGSPRKWVTPVHEKDIGLCKSGELNAGIAHNIHSLSAFDCDVSSHLTFQLPAGIPCYDEL